MVRSRTVAQRCATAIAELSSLAYLVTAFGAIRHGTSLWVNIMRINPYFEKVLSDPTPGPGMDFEKYECQFCGRPAKQYVFAAFCCESEGCVDQAREERGGPGGHMKAKAHGTIVDIKDD